MPWNKAKKKEGELPKEYANSNRIQIEKMFVTKDVENTAYEALTVKKLIRQSSRIIIVTSVYHMLRARLPFEKQGFEVISVKVDYKIV